MIWRFLGLFTLITALLLGLIYTTMRPVGRQLIRWSLHIEAGEVLRGLAPAQTIEGVVCQIGEVGHYTICDERGQVIAGSGKPLKEKWRRLRTKGYCSGRRGDHIFAGRQFQVGGKTYALYLVRDAHLIDEVMRHLRHYGIFVCFSLMMTLSGFYLFVFRRMLKPVDRLMERFKRQSIRGVCQMIEARLDDYDEHLLNERQEKLAILETLEEGVVITTHGRRITYINKKAVSMLRVQDPHPVGQSIEEVASGSLKRVAIDLLNRAIDSQQIERESMSDEDESFFRMIASPIARRGGSVLILHDCSNDHKVYELGKSFVANASHELRTPITIIRGFAETLLEMPEISEAMLHDMAEKIVRSCVRMSNLVKSLLLLADLDNTDKGVMEPIDVCDLVENCSMNVLRAYPQARIETLQNRDTILVWGNIGLLELCLMNLIENGIKYSQADPFITVRVEAIGEEVKIAVQDRGVGIAGKDLRHIFDRFYTVDKARSRKLGGAGLGLSIVRSIIDKHSGQVVATSNPGEGTTFTISLPLSKERAPSVEAPLV